MLKKISLTLLLNNEKLEEMQLPEKHEITIGRSEDRDIKLKCPCEYESVLQIGNPQILNELYGRISRNHFTLRRYDIEPTEKKTEPTPEHSYDTDTLTVSDNGSTNGTRLNNTLLKPFEEKKLKDRDCITTYLYEFKVNIPQN